MPEFVEALGGALAARYTWSDKLMPKRPVTHGQGRQTYMRRLEKKAGGRRAAARAAGIPYSTWGHMFSGKRGVSARNLNKLTGAFETVVMLPAKMAAIEARGYPSQIWIKAVVVADPEGERYINGYKKSADRSKAAVYNDDSAPSYRVFKAEDLESEQIKDVVDTWTTSGTDAAAGVLLAAIEAKYSGPFGFEGPNVEVTLHD